VSESLAASLPDVLGGRSVDPTGYLNRAVSFG
jgi:hypothetical protein